MGAVPSSKKSVQDPEALPRLYPELDYEVKTRSPMPCKNIMFTTLMY